MYQNAFGCQPLHGPAGGAYSAPPDPLTGLKSGRREGEWESRGWGEREGKERNGTTPNVWNAWTPMCALVSWRTADKLGHAGPDRQVESVSDRADPDRLQRSAGFGPVLTIGAVILWERNEADPFRGRNRERRLEQGWLGFVKSTCWTYWC